MPIAKQKRIATNFSEGAIHRCSRPGNERRENTPAAQVYASHSGHCKGPLFALVLALCFWGNAQAQETAHITDVRLAGDLRTVTVQLDATPGKRSAFVLDKPSRLVVDIESAGLGKVPGKINVGRGGVNEIRIGAVNSKARVVVDFGDNPAPPFAVDSVGSQIIVSMGAVSQGTAAVSEPPKPTPVQRAAVRPERPKYNSSPKHVVERPEGLSVKSAKVNNGRIVVELADSKAPGKTERLLIDYDRGAKTITRALVDGRPDAAEAQALSHVDAPEAPDSSSGKVGPRKAADIDASDEPQARKYKWGMSFADVSAQPSEPTVTRKSPFHVEEFQLKRKEVAAAR